ncbi:hypothetical protein [Streptomyces yerevanensis]|uniref:hypothetical protein n=1 Tax=Streptomyces yerevanensis TaxID=66378 RepID=UPI0012FF0531|nr:hypothetical protein [Streptomyces yerevanensis]
MAIVGAVAALLGAVVGAGGAIAAAAVTGRTQVRGQHAQWQRELRRDVYVEFARVCRALAGATIEFASYAQAARDHGFDDQEDRRSKIAELFDLYDECFRAQSLLELECSSREVRSVATATVETLTGMARRQVHYWDPDYMDQMEAILPTLRDLRRRTDSLRPMDIEGQLNLAFEKIDAFIDVARRDLATGST